MENTYKKKVEKGSQKRKWGQVLSMAGMMLVGGICGVYIGEYIAKVSEEKTVGEMIFIGILFFLELYLALILQIIIHEGGHLVFGLYSGYRFSSFRIGSFMWLKEGGSLKLKRMSIAGTGGQCLMCPPDMAVKHTTETPGGRFLADGKIPYILYNLGGVLMNLFAAVVFSILARMFRAWEFVYIFCVMMVVIGIAFALLNGIPMHVGQIDNDGYNAWSLGKTPQALKAFWLQMKINERVAAGERLKSMPDEWFEIPSDEDMKNSMTAAMGVFACSRLMDQMKFAEADKEMERLLDLDSGIVELHRQLMRNDQIYCELVGERDEERLARLYDKEQLKFHKTMKNYPSILRTEYVYALLYEENEEKAAKVLEKFEKNAKKYPHPHEIESERELMGYADRLAIYKNKAEEEESRNEKRDKKKM